MKELLDKASDTIFLCGVSANQNDYLNLFDKVFLLQCSPEIFTSRIDNRENNQFGKHESEKEHILNWYQELESDLISRGAIVINSDAPVANIVNEILGNI